VRQCKEFTSDSVAQFISRESSLLTTSGFKQRRSKKTVTVEQTHLTKAVSMKLEEGNYKGAVRLICSNDVHAPLTDATLQALRLKHLRSPADRTIPRRPEAAPQLIPMADSSVREAIRSFPGGLSSGPDGLTPQHIRDLLLIERGSGFLLSALSTFLGVVVGGLIPASVGPLFFGGRLLALLKKDGGIRPIAVGLTLRCAAAKIVSKAATSKLSPHLAPLQLVVGVKGGIEAAVHATRHYLQTLPSSNMAVVKLDFRNAFKTMRRDSILETVHNTLPETYAFIYSAYSSSTLFHGSNTISSQEGVQQGDPMGSLLFCLTINPMLSDCKAEFRVGYLDDITLVGGEETDIAEEISLLRARAGNLGLLLNDSKCELICNSPTITSLQGFESFTHVSIQKAVLLGSPLSAGEALDKALGARLQSLKTAAARLQRLHSHDALIILKYSLSLPSLLHNL